jgi:hypothetical protein
MVITGRTYAVRKAAAEIRESLAVGRADRDKQRPRKYQPGELRLQC